MNINASPTYHTSIEQKIRAKNCAYRLKMGSPKLREILRLQCRIRTKENRENAFANARNVTTERRVSLDSFCGNLTKFFLHYFIFPPKINVQN